ncbi:MAG: response regulator transcription factor [Endozoicomonas sp. (ex Botrylloides leachii)]|nr:response regulator transcription factor [Endozoicomonas sp. (ex Botrylloides leachii)]
MDKKIIIADDHPLFRAAMQTALKQFFDHITIYEAGSVTELQMLLSTEDKPDLILLDLHMPGAHGFSCLIFLHGHYPDIPVAIVSAAEDPQIISQSIHHGACGFIPKSLPPEDLRNAINTILAKQQWLPAGFSLQSKGVKTSEVEDRLASLTPQQFRVLGMISEGMLNKQIAYDLNVSEATIKAHVTAIFRKLGVRSRTQAVIAIKELEVEALQPESNNSSPNKDPSS